MKIISKAATTLSALVFIGMTSGSAFADGIVLVKPDIQKLVPPIAALSLQPFENRSAHESGGVDYNGSQDVIFGAVAGPQHTVAFSDLGLGRASDLLILLNINESSGNKRPITIKTVNEPSWPHLFRRRCHLIRSLALIMPLGWIQKLQPA